MTFTNNTVPSGKNGHAGLVLVAGLWLTTVIVGMGVLLRYEYKPTTPELPAARWPIDTRLISRNDVSTLVMAVHPHCPCSRASIGELARLMSRCQGKLAAVVLFFKPDEFSGDWEKTDLWRAAAIIPGVTVVSDHNGAEAARFHASTSGQTLLFDHDGKLVFNGGITPSRGHAGDNDGEDAISSLIMTGSSSRSRAPVFGCSLLNSAPLRERLPQNARH